MLNLPNLFSSILTKVETSFQAVAKVVEDDYAKLLMIFPGMAHVVDAEKSALKQQLSNAFAFVDTALMPHYADATSMVESAADTMLIRITGGVAVPAIPLVNVGLEQGFALLHAVLDHKEAQIKAALNLPVPTSAVMPTATVVGQAAAAALAHVG
jgi:hypothetical protein